MYEIYGGKIYDLLNNHEVLRILEDKNQNLILERVNNYHPQAVTNYL